MEWINLEEQVNKNGLFKMIKAKLLWQETSNFIINYLWRNYTYLNLIFFFNFLITELLYFIFK